MRVWIINPFDNLPTEGNRPQRYWLMARAFAQAGHRVTLWTSDFSHATKKKRVLRPEFEVEKGIEVVQIPTRPYSTNVCWARVRSHRQLARTFEQMSDAADSPDLVIASTPPLGLCAAAMRVAKRCGARFVCDIQDAWPETFERLLPRGFKWAGQLLFSSMRRMARRIYREANLVTGVCRRYTELSDRDDFYLSYHGLEIGSPIVRAGQGKLPSLIYVGNLGLGYDLETVIDAVAQVPDLTLDIAGKGPTEERLREKVQILRLGERVGFHGYLGSDELRRLMAHCNVGVVPMRDDSWVGLPYKLGDYAAAGLGIVSSLHGECGELLAKYKCGATYERGDARGLADAIRALPADAGANARKMAEHEFDATKIYSAYVRHVVGMV